MHVEDGQPACSPLDALKSRAKHWQGSRIVRGSCRAARKCETGLHVSSVQTKFSKVSTFKSSETLRNREKSLCTNAACMITNASIKAIIATWLSWKKQGGSKQGALSLEGGSKAKKKVGKPHPVSKKQREDTGFSEGTGFSKRPCCTNLKCRTAKR